VSDRGPTFGRPGGEHRVLEPEGAEPLEATRLDALAELWDGELRLDLEALVLSAASHRAWTERLGSDPSRLTAAFAETIAERGGLGVEARDGTLVGRIVAVGDAHPHPVEVGERVATPLPATAIPLFALPTPDWDGGRVVTLRGHAVLPAAGVTIPVDEAPAAVAAVLAGVADLPASLGSGSRVIVVGVEEPAGAVAVAVASAQMRHVTAVVGSLAAARLARALGADAAAVTAVGEPVAGADHVAAVSGGRPDLVVLASPTGAALAARLAPAVQVLTDPVSAPDVAARVLTHARAAGRSVAVHAGRTAAPDRGAALRALLADRGVLRTTLHWQAGVGSVPTIPPARDTDTL
jgi:L-erythro-3,5-diaminohexanoate dehydrogenase